METAFTWLIKIFLQYSTTNISRQLIGSTFLCDIARWNTKVRLFNIISMNHLLEFKYLTNSCFLNLRHNFIIAYIILILKIKLDSKKNNSHHNVLLCYWCLNSITAPKFKKYCHSCRPITTRI